MAGNGRKNGVFGYISMVLVLILALVAIVVSGAWPAVNRSLGIGNVTDASQLEPGEQDRQPLGLKGSVPIPTPTGSATEKPWGQITIPMPDSIPTPGATTGTGNVGSGEGTAADGTGTAQGNGVDRQNATLPAAAKSPIDYPTALEWANQIQTATPHVKGYAGNRAKLFGTWAANSDMGGSASTRDFILARDMTNVKLNQKHQVDTGTLLDPYTGRTIDFQRDQYTTSFLGGTQKTGGDSQAVQIDHIVALNDAWASGLWQDDRAADRVKYANDPEVLLASEGDANNRKSEGINLKGPGIPNGYRKQWKTTGEQRWTASTPSIWLPSNETYRCDYMAKRVYIKHKWNLTMSAWEKTETVNYLTQCATQNN